MKSRRTRPKFCSRFDAEACKDTQLRTLMIVNGAVGSHAAPQAIAVHSDVAHRSQTAGAGDALGSALVTLPT